MKEIKAIINAYDRINKATTQAALATVVRVEGSSYRRTGARMLVLDNGVWVGGISGGCLEGDALKRARLAITRSSASLVTYDTTDDDAHQIGVGLGCNGIIDVLFTPLHYEDENNAVGILKKSIQKKRQTHVFITITDLQGQWQHVKTGNLIEFTGAESLHVFGNKDLELELLQNIDQQLTKNKSAPGDFELGTGEKLSVFIEILLPEIHVVLMGHQYDVYPLSRLAKEVGWQVTMVANPLKINADYARAVDHIVSEDHFTDIPFDEYTAIILMSHDFKTDKKNLLKALQTEVPYVAMLGPRIRSERIISEHEKEGHLFSEVHLAKIHAPAGLDIGAQTPEEIALSLLAEIRTVFSNREGGFLKLRDDPIHERN